MPGRVLAVPSTRRLARELGVDISKVKGTGPGGRITDEDVRKSTVTEAKLKFHRRLKPGSQRLHLLKLRRK